MSILMIDGVTADVPVIYQRFGAQTPVAGYVTGPSIEWTENQFGQFTRKIRIAQSFDLALDEASDARCLDVETGAATHEDWPAFYASRTDKARATCYCDLFNVPLVLAACQPDEVPPRWWLAWYWQRPGRPTQAQVLDALKRETGVVLPGGPSSLWAVQYANWPYWDESAVFGTPDFSRR